MKTASSALLCSTVGFRAACPGTKTGRLSLNPLPSLVVRHTVSLFIFDFVHHCFALADPACSAKIITKATSPSDLVMAFPIGCVSRVRSPHLFVLCVIILLDDRQRFQ